MKKCPFCAEEIQDAAIVCKHCGRDLQAVVPRVQQVELVEPKKHFWNQPIGCGGLVGLLFVGWCAYNMQSQERPRTLPPPPPITQDPGPASAELPTDVDQVLTRYGSADSDRSTQFDKPRPLIVTRILEYKKENVRLAFVPDVPNGLAPPPYKKWKLVGCIDTLKQFKISDAEAARRLGARVK